MDTFVVITWPDVQILFEFKSFRENSLLINDGPLYDKYGDSAYMVNKEWFDTRRVPKEITLGWDK